MKDIIIVAGPTAVGKTEYALEIAKAVDGEIVSADSMQIYRYMNIGSAKPSAQELAEVPHHLVDEIDPLTRFSVAEYQKLAKEHIREIQSRGKKPVISGGTGLYISSLIYDMDFAGESINLEYRKSLERLAEEKGGNALHQMLSEMDPEAAERIHPNNIKKMIRAMESVQFSGEKVKSFDHSRVETADYTYDLIGLTRNRSELYDRINKRVDIMFEQGLVSEVESLISMGLTSADISMKGIGYKEIISYINGECTLGDAMTLIQKSTRHYAKKQLTWLRSYDHLKWFDLSSYEDKNSALEDILSWLKRKM